MPHPTPAAALLSLVHAAAIAVAVANPGRPTIAGIVVLAGLTARWLLRHRRSVAAADVVVLTPEAAPAAAA
ncbi:hypothetical protein DQ237_10930 [Blastococcus sp. TF02-8]|nr:hypothetical protein DQ237_10930 [Blastococcus sp. TF02-8]